MNVNIREVLLCLNLTNFCNALNSITIPMHESIKRIYVLLVKEAVERIDEDEAGKNA